MDREAAKRALLKLNFSEVHAEVYLRAKGKCEYCGVDLIRDRMAFAGIQIDHILPVSSGGTSGQDNLALSCTICNSIKSNWKPDQTLSRGEQLLQARAYIGDKLRSHDELWIKVNEALREIWWGASDT